MMATTAFNATNHGLQIGNNSGTITAEFHVARAYTTEDIDRICLRALRCPDSWAVKNQLKESKDKLVHRSIHWILQDAQYKDWANGDEVGLLWIKGGAGKGKTMLSIGIIEELARMQDESALVIYFFCQNADYELNTLEAIIKGLILQLVNQQPELKESLRRRWDTVLESFSEDVTSWQSLWNILLEMLARCKSSRVYVVIDALDECQDKGIADFLKSIVRKGLDHPAKLKWMLTSRPWDGAERVLLAGHDQVQVSLDGEVHSQSVSEAVEAYITSKVEELSRQHRYGATLTSEIKTELTTRSEGTFLWVGLVCKALESVRREEALSTVQSLPPGLHPFYERVLNQLNEGEPAEVQKCMRLLKAMMTVYRPLKVEEVPIVLGLNDEEDTIRALVDCCASFIRLRDDNIEFVHQSARDYLAGENALVILDSHERFGHEEIVLACLSSLSECLKPNLAGLPQPDATRDFLVTLENGPGDGLLSRVDYAAIFWVLHLQSTSNDTVKSQVSIFLRTKLLEWLECLSLLDKLPKAIDALKALESILKDDHQALALVQDAMRFLLRHYHTLSHWPLQTYSSAIIFSPESSVVKRESLHKLPAWLREAPLMEDSWSPMLQTLGGHSETVNIVAFSPDGTQIASGSNDGTIRLYDSITGRLQQTISGHSWQITAMRFLPDSKLIVAGAHDSSIRLWDTTTGDEKMMTDHWGPTGVHYSHLDGPEEDQPPPSAVAFSEDCKQIAASGWFQGNQAMMLFDTATGELQKILTGHSDTFLAVAFSPDNRQLVAGCFDRTVRLWDTATGDLQQTLVGHTSSVWTVAFSPDGSLIASGSDDAVKIWNGATGDLQKTLASNAARSVAFSPDNSQLAAGFADGTIHILDAAGNLLKTLERHSSAVMSVAFSPDGRQLVTGSSDETIKRWDTTIGAIQSNMGHSDTVITVALSPDGKVIASGSADKTIKLWNAATSDLQKTLKGHLYPVSAVVFSPDNKQIASCSYDAVNLWDATTGDLFRSFPESENYCASIAFSPNGKQLASGYENGIMNLWDTSTGNLQQTLTGHSRKFETLTGLPLSFTQVKALTYSPNGQLIASASEDGTIKLWDAATGDLQKTLDCNPESIITAVSVALTTGAHANTSIITVAFSPDSQLIAAACDDETIKIWNIKKSLKASKYLGRAVGSHIKSTRPWKEITTSHRVHTLQFAEGNRYLETDLGLIALDSTPADGEENLPVGLVDSLQKLYVRDGWLCYGAMPFLRLLPDSKAVSWDAHGDQVVVGFTNGQVSRFDVDRRSLQPYWKTLQL